MNVSTVRRSLIPLCAIFLLADAAAQTSSKSKARNTKSSGSATPKKSSKTAVSPTPKPKATPSQSTPAAPKSTPTLSGETTPKATPKATSGATLTPFNSKAATPSGKKSGKASTPKTTPKKTATPKANQADPADSIDSDVDAPLPTKDPKPRKSQLARGTSDNTGDSAKITAAVDPVAPSPGKLAAAPNASLSSSDLVEFAAQPPRIKKLIETALELTTRNLTYAYGSADPARGGMDCSGFIYYVLRQNGIEDVPRQASEQYVWLRKAKEFDAVLSKRKTSFELNDLKPGDLLFWTGTYSADRDPPVTHSMIYLGTERKTKNPVMAGSSDGRAYAGKSRWGVSVFDFNGGQTSRDPAKEGRGAFVGYATIPGLRD